MDLEMIGGWAGGRKVYVGSVTEEVTPSEPYPNDKMAFSERGNTQTKHEGIGKTTNVKLKYMDKDFYHKIYFYVCYTH